MRVSNRVRPLLHLAVCMSVSLAMPLARSAELSAAGSDRMKDGFLAREQGLFDRATGSAPFALPPPWLAAQSRLNAAQRLNFSTTHDTTGGNSGSPIVNRQGEIGGLLFNGNLGSLGGAFSYDEHVNRSVGVHAGATFEALRRVYRADTLLAELLAGS